MQSSPTSKVRGGDGGRTNFHDKPWSRSLHHDRLTYSEAGGSDARRRPAVLGRASVAGWDTSTPRRQRPPIVPTTGPHQCARLWTGSLALYIPVSRRWPIGPHVGRPENPQLLQRHGHGHRDGHGNGPSTVVAPGPAALRRVWNRPDHKASLYFIRQ